MNEVRELLIGFEFGRETSEICYYDRKSEEPVCVTTKVGTNLFDFPSILAYVPSKNEWHFGLEAEYFGKLPGGIMVSSVYDLAFRGGSIRIADREMEASELLRVFFLESLKLLGIRNIVQSISKIVVTTREISAPLVFAVRKAMSSIGLMAGHYSIQDHRESFYYYTYSQRPDLWTRSVMLFHFEKRYLSAFLLCEKKDTNPIEAGVQTLDSVRIPEGEEEKNRALLDYAAYAMKGNAFSGVLMTGGSFDPDVYKPACDDLSRERNRIYFEDDLFVKGACYAAYEQAERHAFRGRVFMSESRVRMNIGMDMIVGTNTVTVPLIRAGSSWFEASESCELILDDRDYLIFTLQEMGSAGRRNYRMDLPELPKRPNRTTRIRLTLACLSPEVCEIRAEDLGFGDFYPATHRIWKGSVSLLPETAD
ncbi:MAG: hypothetical protein J6D46_01175 [Lachnospiraceae bacterium]|nr:hypothetical protein [Lachnospiraceae bacterium]